MRNLFLFSLLLAGFSWAYPPGAINPDVTQENIDQTICVPGYTHTIRPPTNYTNSIKKLRLKEAGLAASQAAEFELDHIIPLALGGNPRAQDNLMLQRWDGLGGAKKKDRLEVKLQHLVCQRKLPLEDARNAIYDNWSAAYAEYVGKLQTK